jgi:(S)-ureidoglycine aminohydrolase
MIEKTNEVNEMKYAYTPAQYPPPTAIVTGESLITDWYAIIPASVLNDTVASRLPGWSGTRCWVLCAPSIGRAVGITQYEVFVESGGGSQNPDPESGVESTLFVLTGAMELTIGSTEHHLSAGGFAFIPSETSWSLQNSSDEMLRFLWIRKAYEPYDGPPPKVIVGNEQEVEPDVSTAVPKKWRIPFMPSDDISYDMHVNISNYEPGAVIPFAETHVMEHTMYLLEGKGLYFIHDRWHEVKAGDFIWMKAFCPQMYVCGPIRTRYMLYKNINRHFLLGRSA